MRPTNALTDEEAFAILDLAKTHHPDERLRALHYAILSLFLSTGMRKNELLELKGNSYCEIDGIPGLKIFGKGGKIREIPLTEQSKQALDAYLEMMSKNMVVLTCNA
ncbi:MAG: tyrosine-type recombinase/integrase [Oligoflexia bacterium]|nr:tyrosine-type recombinase/integrase [Oligoflexia bacterium]